MNNKKITPLKALKRMVSDNGYNYSLDNFWEDYKVVETALKALEIIKRCPVEVISCWDTYSDWEEYRKDYYNKAERKGLIETKEEFELLKEELRNEN